MCKALLLVTLSLISITCFALNSTTYSALFTLDTVAPTINLNAPNGGEVWYIGDTNNIVWSATDTNLSPNTVCLWFSLNGGGDYNSIAQNIFNNGTYSWPMPDIQSYNVLVLIQAQDDFGNLGEATSNNSFTIAYAPPAAPENVNVNISNNVDAVISWNPVTQTIFGTPIAPDGYILLYNETPYEDADHLYYFLWDVSSGTSFTHPRVVRYRDQFFYRVVAYKDYESRMADIFAIAKADPEAKLTLEDIRTLFMAELGGAK